jgi:hypothetical protein
VCEVDGRTEVDIKRYVRVEKIPGGMLYYSIIYYTLPVSYITVTV